MESLFKTEEFIDDDDVWTALFVWYNNQWRMAMPIYGTEDKEILKWKIICQM
jgi:hypothetical protein